jgi:hypothetical protein
MISRLWNRILDNWIFAYTIVLALMLLGFLGIGLIALWRWLCG